MEKKKMKTKSILLFAIFLVSIMPLISAFYWTSYGGDYTPMWSSSLGGYFGRFDLGVSNDYISDGMNVSEAISHLAYEPLIYDFGDTENYIVIGSGNYLKMYDSSLSLIDEISTGKLVSQLDITNFTGTGSPQEVVGLFDSGYGIYQVKSFSYDGDILAQTSELNLSIGSPVKIAGIRCAGDECYMMAYDTTESAFVWFNSTSWDFTDNGIIDTMTGTKEPPAWIDYDSDGDMEFLVYNDTTYVLFEKDGTIDVTKEVSNSLEQVKMYQSDATGNWRFATIQKTSDVSPTLSVYVYKEDGSSYWSATSLVNLNNPIYFGTSGYGATGRLAIVDDYEGSGDYYPDIYVVITKARRLSPAGTTYYVYRVLEGDTGNALLSGYKTETDGDTGNREDISLVVADMNGDNYEDFILKSDNAYLSSDYIYIIDGDDGSYVNKSSFAHAFYSCVPADISFDGFLDVVCSGLGGTEILYSGGVNLLPTISLVNYDPSTSVEVGETLTATITASDNEGNTIYYRHKCSNSDVWSSENTNNVKTCDYVSEGTYNMSVAVSDIFHSEWSIYSHDISVTAGEVGVCDNDGVCEDGETAVNCPNDCYTESNDTIQTEGGTSIPLELVDTEDFDSGLLPEIYFGSLAFFSGVLSPFVILVFLIFSVLIIITIGAIIKKIFSKVANG